ncbi:OmpA/MotB family protein [Planctopirus hydrillae]|uniref:Flagellar motor protein MotB n=1 Tax=Planctopirus hydrillae TaxID=1841610 RepID=A0A1C3E6S8_9PLAN|nr:OmpA family protein [Planctopirus hydrillae]ODA28913.1 flagellar motor protein MotB [Planctopirus hydrillae]
MGPYLRCLVLALLCLVVAMQSGCHCREKRMLRQSQLHSRQLYQQYQGLAMERNQFQGNLSQLMAEKAQLEQQNATLRNGLELANQRVDNMLAANSSLEDKVKNMLTSSSKNPLSTDANQRMEELRRKYPDFEFDPQTGVSKFQENLLFASGSDEIRPEAYALLQEFARIMNSADSKHLKVLVVGHTDDKPISRKAVADKHPTNWHLSTDRANSVVLALKKSGLAEQRMGAAGYSLFQPLAPNTDDKNRQKNRRVEIFVLAPDAVVAGWESGGTNN